MGTLIPVSALIRYTRVIPSLQSSKVFRGVDTDLTLSKLLSSELTLDRYRTATELLYILQGHAIKGYLYNGT